MNKNHIKELTNQLLSGDRASASKTFKRLMTQSVAECVQESKRELAQTYFKAMKNGSN